ncbi:substrate-binding domain-containing protein [Streptomyces sp. NBC_01077]|uniref:substrate-binding domain-containing protein n=1 Tax=Streptomyces sp. NBC_01077 TaxID=2903746 RepID=UPI00386C819D|nr:substrate-binding domain-containing protein [Streptomyces sp. NBC_01077]
MDWLTAENLIAVITALLGVLVSTGAVWYERRVPHQRRIGYRVQLDTAIGAGATHLPVTGPGTTVRRGFFDTSPELANADATIVLLRIENDGGLAITADHYTDGANNGLTVVFGSTAGGTEQPGRRRHVKALVVTAPDHPGLLTHFPDSWRGPADGATSLVLPKVPLNRGAHYKLLVLLTGGPIGTPVEVHGNIAEGVVHVNHSTTPDDKPPVFSRVARAVTVVLTLCVIALAVIIVREQTPPPIGCATGSLTVTGSTAFAPVVRELAKKYEKDCEGATVSVEAHGSTAGIRRLAEEGAKTAKGSPAVIALSDGRKPGGFPQLRESMVAVSLYTLVLNDGVPVDNLTLDQIRRIYRGEIKNWAELVPSMDQPIHLVSRDANSGTREVFQRRVLGRNEPANSSLDCQNSNDSESAVIRCELDSTEQVLSTVAKLPGAIGYTELRDGTGLKGLHRVAIDGRRPVLDEIGESSYPYREIEYAYTWGEPPADSLTSSFLTYLRWGSGQDVIRTHGHLPCSTPKGLRICGDG